MSDIAKLKAAAERAKAAVADYQSGVIDAAEFHRRAAEFHRLTDSPEQALELIAALEAMQRANAAQDGHINQQQDRIDKLEKGHQEAAKQINSWRRIAKENIAEREKDIAALDEARKRIAELEARKIAVRFDTIPMSDLGNRSDGKKHPHLFGAGYNSATAHYESELRRACAAAGINLETGGE
ncbi:hypothetical protein AAAW47_002825 [Cronobacter sakazakii]|uniref:hypothetical protein n=1 Tax=Cronobacter sakazakii TaxID=28141 RepID=UPI000A18D9A1|nr:hypothetical protein [Cronobacter sakazakii]EMC4334365.1 hypothetical protein [Cronobacter sakazakii]MDK1113650.1 hypothetical protein [Cronobacter sakazakii]